MTRNLQEKHIEKNNLTDETDFLVHNMYEATKNMLKITDISALECINYCTNPPKPKLTTAGIDQAFDKILQELEKLKSTIKI